MGEFWGGLWDFATAYWWLIFFVGPAAGGVAKAIERSAKRRHERRLEIIRAKAEAKGIVVRPTVGDLTARDGSTASGSASPSATDADDADASVRTRIERLFAAHDDLTHRWLEYELDVAKLIAFPAMSDGRQPLTAAFLRAKKIADGLRPPSADARVTASDLAAYRDAVTDAEVAFDLAERDARRQRDHSFSEVERRRLDTAKQLLNVAVDDAATPAERRTAYERVRAELDGLIAVSDAAMDRLAQRAALQLPPTAPPAAS
ncbi:hypothetical protein [Microbacterium thalli]|uniref:Uncharacterized protein n=1 Tax=Microbacterium thalli TaxID=3027921 RepID=A0ABT5SFS7_9MICO|nr:hypothetical protein [Microbacterium thalli]MDD7928381.1 hypothetical protein [Microbacterium thalli]MDD7960962.1 hypothetical protein [Microbacterium thalli]MDN8549779.1 hypothetical protein [Microbacterium thalli]